MKVRLTILTENDSERKDVYSPELIKWVWQRILDRITEMSESDDTATVENVEILD